MYMDEPEDVEGTVLQASRVYLLMSKEYRISRNRRAEWFFSNLNAIVTIQPKYKLVKEKLASSFFPVQNKLFSNFVCRNSRRNTLKSLK